MPNIIFNQCNQSPKAYNHVAAGALVAAMVLAACGSTEDRPISASSDASGSGGAGGTETDAPFTPSDGASMCGATAGACVNATDCAVDMTLLEPKIAMCALSCTGSSQCTADCLQPERLTPACAKCYGDVTQCGRDNCSAPCFADSSSMACRDCVSGSGCNERFAACSGL